MLSLVEYLYVGTVFYVYWRLFFRPYAYALLPFKCLRCGNCCKHFYVELTDKETARISSNGFKNFLELGNRIKRPNGSCYFLKFDNGLASCSIHNIKPEACKKWPHCTKGLLPKIRIFDKCKFYSRCP